MAGTERAEPDGQGIRDRAEVTSLQDGDAGAKALAILVGDLGGSRWGDWTGVRIRAIALDSREVEPGTLFVALPGQSTHGVHHIPDALARGAVALWVPVAVSETVRTRWPDYPGWATPDPRALLGAVAARLYGHPADQLRLVGVTGTNGKTTVAYMLAQILEAADRTVALWSTAWAGTRGQGGRPRMTTPEAPVLHRFLAEAVSRGATDAVLEVSSHAVVLRRIAGLRFAAGVVTNLSPDHLDFHGSLTAYVDAKRRFVAELPEDAVAVLNADDPVVRSFREAARGAVVTFGTAPEADVWARSIEPEGAGFIIRVRLATTAPGAAPDLVLRLALPGRHNVANALAALAAATALGVPRETAAAALERFAPPVRRLQSRQVGPYTVVDDVAMNPGSYEAVLATVADWGRPVVLVNALRGNRGTEVNRHIAQILARWAPRLGVDHVIATESRSQVALLPVDYRVRPEERAAFEEAAQAAGLPVVVHPELETALDEAVAELEPGGVLLLLGTFGMDAGPDLAVARLWARLATE
jgi:UDP-N-acetylmuramoyl-L-alanyl-D-glutamate--2,6-diaminopimelate ligase